MSSPRVSVVIPVFNRPGDVRRAVDSVLAQTCPDFELIVVDDASTDETPCVLGAIGDPRLRVVRHERRRGGSAARNTGIRAGSAPYIAFLDSDDEWLPEKLARQLDAFDRGGSDLALVYTGSEAVFGDGSRRVHIPQRKADLALSLLLENVVGETSVGMVRRSAVEDVGGFDESLPSSQELDLWLRLCERYRADLVAEALVRLDKGHERDRISTNISSTTLGRELFRQKHRDKLRRHGLLHLHLRESGWWFLRGARNSAEAKRCYLEALKAQPLAPLTYVFLATTFLPMGWIDGLVSSKQRVTRMVNR